MDFELVRLPQDGPWLHGIYSANKADRGLVIHVHGLAGNFYENDLNESTLEIYYQAGFSIAALNFPGHDAEHKTENYADFTPALDGWLSKIGTTQENIILQGHSLGVHKILSYQDDRRAKYVDRIRAISMLAPFDPIADWGSFDDLERERRLNWVTEVAIDEGMNKIVYDESWMFWPMSAGTMQQLLTPGTLIDEVAVREGIPKLAWEGLPRFAAVGDSDIYCLPSPKEVIDLLSKHGVTSALIPDADHNFMPNIQGLQTELENWLSTLKI